MTEPVIYGHTNTGRPITDQLVAELVVEAEAGYDVDELRTARAQRRDFLSDLTGPAEQLAADPEDRAEMSEVRELARAGDYPLRSSRGRLRDFPFVACVARAMLRSRSALIVGLGFVAAAIPTAAKAELAPPAASGCGENGPTMSPSKPSVDLPKAIRQSSTDRVKIGLTNARRPPPSRSESGSAAAGCSGATPTRRTPASTPPPPTSRSRCR